jgi:hypothetical protein
MQKKKKTMKNVTSFLKLWNKKGIVAFLYIYIYLFIYLFLFLFLKIL